MSVHKYTNQGRISFSDRVIATEIMEKKNLYKQKLKAVYADEIINEELEK